jgi:hypothetical protein
MAPDGVEFINVHGVQRTQLLWTANVTGAPEMVSTGKNPGHAFVPDFIEVAVTWTEARRLTEVTINGAKLTPTGKPGTVRVECAYRTASPKGTSSSWSNLPKWVRTRLDGLQDRP